MAIVANRKLRVLIMVSPVVLLGLVALRLWLYPVDVILCDTRIGSISLEHLNSRRDAIFTAPQGGISAISFALPGLQYGIDLTCLSLHVHIADVDNGDVVMDEVITNEQMQWTNWHASKSFTLVLNLTECLLSGNRYDLRLKVLSPEVGIGTADVYLHWLDLRYIWGRERQEIYPVINGRTTPQED